MRDLYNNISASQVLHPVMSSTTKTSSVIDLQGFNSTMVLFALGLSGDTLSGSVYWSLKLQESDDDSLYTDVASASLLGGGAATIVVDSSSEDEQTYTFGYIGTKRYLKGVATPTGTHTNGTPIGIIALRGHAARAPVAQG